MTRGERSNYDSFMIRLWHGAGGVRLLRAEIDHIQTGAVYIGREAPAGWIEQTVRESIRQRTESPDADVEQRDLTQEKNDHASCS